MLRPLKNSLTFLQRLKECKSMVRCIRHRSDLAEYECEIILNKKCLRYNPKYQ